jgi:hypothetical protein
VTERRRDVLALAPLIMAALVGGHDLTYLVTYGPDYRSALLRTGHGEAWSAAVVTVGLLSIALAVLAGLRLATLSREGRNLGAQHIPVAKLRGRDLAREVIGLWAVVVLGALVLFAINENVERAISHLPTTGLGVLLGSGTLPIPLIVLSVVSGAVAAVAALYRWRRDVLIARLHAAGVTWSRATSDPLPRPWPSLPRPNAAIVRHLAGRAPPRLELLSSPC